jgi:glycosyltransferase involved in cell wall biosynthesis
LAGRVRHLGYVGDPDRERLYREASMLVLPSFDEGFGMPVLEAMTVGTPVVAASRGALPEVAGDAGLLVNPDDPEGLAAAMERLLRDSDLARQCRDRGIERARRFAWETSAHRLIAAYRDAIERRRSRKP